MPVQYKGNIIPAAEDRIKSRIKGDALQNALDFVGFLRENDITLDYNARESDYGERLQGMTENGK